MRTVAAHTTVPRCRSSAVLKPEKSVVPLALSKALWQTSSTLHPIINQHAVGLGQSRAQMGGAHMSCSSSMISGLKALWNTLTAVAQAVAVYCALPSLLPPPGPLGACCTSSNVYAPSRLTGVRRALVASASAAWTCEGFPHHGAAKGRCGLPATAQQRAARWLGRADAPERSLRCKTRAWCRPRPRG